MPLIESNMKLGYQDQAEDRLSLLPDALLISILSYIDTKLAVLCSVLSKRWVNLWTLIPVLNFDFSCFEYRDQFHRFIEKVFARRDVLIQVDSLNIKVGCDNTNYIVPRVFDYALLHGVHNVSIYTSSEFCQNRILCNTSSDLLITLSLKGWQRFGKCLNFNGLVSLRLKRVRIINKEPFSSFPNLENLKLVKCWLLYHLEGLEVIGTQLSRLKISSCCFNNLVLLTPKLVLFELKGYLPMSIKAFELPVLDTAHIDCVSDFVHSPYMHQQKLSLITVLRGLRHAIYIHLSPSTVELLSRSHDMLVKEHFQFDNLKVLNLFPPKNKSPGRLFFYGCRFAQGLSSSCL